MKSNLFFVLTALVILSFGFENTNAAPRNVLIEYVTGTWCGNCPCGHQTVNTILNQHPNTIVLAYHAFSNDPFRNFNGNEIVGLFGFSSTPTSSIDRNVFIGTLNYPLWTASVNDRYGTSPDAPVNIDIISKSYNEINRELTVNVEASALEDLNGQYKITAVIAEDNIIYQQNFYSQCGTPGIVQNYTHDHVTRNIINGAAGENLNSGGTWSNGQMISKNFQTTLDASWNAENCNIVIYVYREESSLRNSEVQQAVMESVTGTTGITPVSSSVPVGYELSQNYPNPFNPNTNIKFSIPEDGNVSFKVYDISGKTIGDYVNGFLQRGSYNVEIDGSGFASGLYFYELRTEKFSDRKKMILLK
ncbi:MAG: Omp28-related outer membrane protein [Bacteroidetes bacterium]|nr:Omp28-related outer membrane protein [Bacteroidota bacterium]